MNPIHKIALIGCGRIGYLLENDILRNKPCSHAGGCIANKLKITYAVDSNPKKLAEFSQKFNIPSGNSYLNHLDLFKSTTLDMIIISTYTDSHTQIAVDALKHGVKIIILEKPVGYSLFEVKKLLKTAAANKAHIIVNHERRYDPRYIKVKEIINSGKIGKILNVTASIHTGGFRGVSHPKLGGGPLLHDGTHLVDILRFFFGDITQVRGKFQRESRHTGFEDIAYAWLETLSGINIFMQVGGPKNYFGLQLEIFGTCGQITIGNGINKLYVSSKSKFYQGFNDLCEVNFPKINSGNCFTNMYKEVKNILYKKADTVTSSLYDGYKALEIVHSIYLSSYNKGNLIKLPLSPSSVNLNKIFSIR
jgi:predicted dehydrogenase